MPGAPQRYVERPLSDVTFVDLLNGAPSRSLSLQAGQRTSLDLVVFGQDRGMVEIGKDLNGDIVIFDKRNLWSRPVQSLLHSVYIANLPHEMPMKLNGADVPTGRCLPLQHGDLLQFLGTSLGIERPAASPIQQELANLERPLQD